MQKPLLYIAQVPVRWADMDSYGHVNNTVWVRWMEDIATAHWTRDADPAHVAAYAWVVTRHEIDYLRAARQLGELHADAGPAEPVDRLAVAALGGGRRHHEVRAFCPLGGEQGIEFHGEPPAETSNPRAVRRGQQQMLWSDRQRHTICCE